METTSTEKTGKFKMQLTIKKRVDYSGTEWKVEAENFRQHSREAVLDADDEFIDCILSRVLGEEVCLSFVGDRLVTIDVFDRKTTTPLPEIIDTAEKLRDYIITIVKAIKDVEVVTNSVTFEI